MKRKKYKVVISPKAVSDIKSIKLYILKTFKYREYAEHFSTQIKKTIKDLEFFPQKNQTTEYCIKNKKVYVCPYNTYLIFYVIDEANVIVIRVLKDRMYWQTIIERTCDI